MATRATYLVDGHLFYGHWDGDLEGAAERFKAMVDADDHSAPRHVVFEQVADVESVPDPDTKFGDIEYHYVLAGDTVTMYQGFGSDGMERVATVPLTEFTEAP